MTFEFYEKDNDGNSTYICLDCGQISYTHREKCKTCLEMSQQWQEWDNDWFKKNKED